MTDKPDLTKVWAENADPTDIKNPDLDEAGKFQKGWLSEIPPHTWFNYIQNNFSAALAHFNEYGVAQWDSNTVYPVGGWARSTVDDEVYVALVAQSGNEPSSSPVEWKVLHDYIGNVFGLGESGDPETGSDFDNVVKTGFYRVYTGATNVQFEPGTLIHVEREGGAGANQINMDRVDSKIAIRTRNSAGVWQPWVEIGGSGDVKVTVITSSTPSFSPEPSAVKIEVTAIGAGGGSGGAVGGGSGDSSAGAGGGGGATCRKIFAPSGTYNIVIGAAGTGGAAGNNNGTAGGNTTVTGTNAAMTAGGGGGGSGQGAVSGYAGNFGADGGISTGGDENIRGSRGGSGRISKGQLVMVAYGGSSSLGGAVSSAGGDGVNAVVYGGGAAGAGNDGEGQDRSGGDGANGVVIIKEFF